MLAVSIFAFLQASPCWASAKASRIAPADVVITDAIIYTADVHRTVARALAIGAGKLLYVGDESGARAFIGPHTRVERLQGRLVP